MAVKKKDDTIEIVDNTIIVEETIEVQDVIADTEEVEVKIEVPVAKTRLDENVRIKPKASFNTSIGGEWFYFTEGVCQNVPLNVKRVLQEGDMLLPL